MYLDASINIECKTTVSHINSQKKKLSVIDNSQYTQEKYYHPMTTLR